MKWQSALTDSTSTLKQSSFIQYNYRLMKLAKSVFDCWWQYVLFFIWPPPEGSLLKHEAVVFRLGSHPDNELTPFVPRRPITRRSLCCHTIMSHSSVCSNLDSPVLKDGNEKDGNKAAVKTAWQWYHHVLFQILGFCWSSMWNEKKKF